MTVSAVLAILRKLELETHEPHVRADPRKLRELLHPDFFEVGRSGERYSRDTILAEFRDQPPSYRIWSQDFQVELLTDDLALLTYRSAHVAEDGTLERHTRRSSLWQRAARGWQLRFHQGTPVAAFEKHAAGDV